MIRVIQETIEGEIDGAIAADEQANAQYYQAIRQFITIKSTRSDAKMEAASLKEIDAAWITKECTDKNLRKAYMKLYGTRLKHTS